MRKVEVVPHNRELQNLFEAESRLINRVLAPNVIAIHHIGSTDISSIYAKLIINLLVAVKEINYVDKQNSRMETIGYKAMGEFGIVGRRYFCKHNLLGIRTHHVRIFTSTSSEIGRHLGFRDYLIAHPIKAIEYSLLKQKLVQQYPYDI